MKKILIANRGEIACRIIESCKKLNLHTIAVYSDADKKSKHVRIADEAVHIGESKAQESYLSTRKIINAALSSKADAIHPGYGFLSENAEFAQSVMDSGITWIGPKPNNITSMGNKDIARELAIKSNLPICPGLKNDEIKVCVGNKSIEDGILKQRLDATKKFDIKATPTLYINGKKYEGDLTFEAIKLKINTLLN